MYLVKGKQKICPLFLSLTYFVEFREWMIMKICGNVINVHGTSMKGVESRNKSVFYLRVCFILEIESILLR